MVRGTAVHSNGLSYTASQDFSAFQQPGFDAKEWVNAILAENRPNDEPQEVRSAIPYCATVIMTLCDRPTCRASS